jgi:hypothetical protein
MGAIALTLVRITNTVMRSRMAIKGSIQNFFRVLKNKNKSFMNSISKRFLQVLSRIGMVPTFPYGSTAFFKVPKVETIFSGPASDQSHRDDYQRKYNIEQSRSQQVKPGRWHKARPEGISVHKAPGLKP